MNAWISEECQLGAVGRFPGYCRRCMGYSRELTLARGVPVWCAHDAT
jgi:hypothetical protein